MARWVRWMLLGIVLLAAAGLRVRDARELSLSADELWSLELAAGRGTAHLNLPVGVVMAGPMDLSRTLRPWWTVPGTLGGVTHPPGYYTVLAMWRAVVGDGAFAARSLSVAMGVGAVALLYVAVRRTLGESAGLWAAAMMAVGGPQVTAGAEARGYAMATLLALAAVVLLVRMRDGGRWGSAVGLAVAVGALLLTHYFAAATAVAIGVAALGLPRGVRGRAVGAIVAGGVIAAAVWGPAVIGQWRAGRFSTADASAEFLARPGPGHVRTTLLYALATPAMQLVETPRKGLESAAAVGVVMLVPLALRRRAPAVVAWGLGMWVPVGMLLALDLLRRTGHLEYVRYHVLAGPAVYAVIGAIPSALGASVGVRKLAMGVPAAAVLWCGVSTPRWFGAPRTDWVAATGRIDGLLAHRPGVPVVYAGLTYVPGALLLVHQHYTAQGDRPVAVWTRGATVPAMGETFYVLSEPWFADETGAAFVGYRTVESILEPGSFVLRRYEWDRASAR